MKLNKKCESYAKPVMTMYDDKNNVIDTTFMYEAIKEAYDGIYNGEGGPFGCVIVKDSKIVGRGHNQVVSNHDPTCHGEMQAIRDACKNLGTFNLSGCVLYTTAYPCPMCLGAMQWANISQCYYGCNLEDTESIGFRDNKFYKDIFNPIECGRKQCLTLFNEYSAIENKINY